MANKWIVNDNIIKLSSAVEFHKELAQDHTTTKGGGFWYLDRASLRLYFYDESGDFKRCTEQQVRDAFPNSHFPNAWKGVELYFSATALTISQAKDNSVLIGKIE